MTNLNNLPKHLDAENILVHLEVMKKPYFPVKTPIVVRFSDVDIMGHVNNAKYLSYFEQARVEYYKNMKSLDLRKMNGHSAVGFIVGEINVKFHAPAYVDETLIVSVRVAEMRTKAYRMEYEIREKSSKRLITTGYSVQVMYNYKKEKTILIPEDLRRRIMKLERMASERPGRVGQSRR